jgi:CHAT domain-containing protein
MSRFYTEILTKHLAPAAALRAAQLSMLPEPRWSNPHYWAAFRLHGEWQ